MVIRMGVQTSDMIHPAQAVPMPGPPVSEPPHIILPPPLVTQAPPPG